MADMEEEAELLLLAIQDFKHALASGCSEATATLQSYLVELRGAPDELLHFELLSFGPPNAFNDSATASWYEVRMS